mgnify:CR=1 FL=1
MPARLTSWTVGLSPTSELVQAGSWIELIVSDPIAAAQKPAATAVAGPAQEGQIAGSTIQIPATPTAVATAAQAPSTSAETKQASAGTSGTTRTRLPQTGSSAPALTLLGIGMLAAGTMLFRWPRLRV